MSILTIIKNAMCCELEQAIIRLALGVVVALFVISQLLSGNRFEHGILLAVSFAIFNVTSMLLVYSILRDQGRRFWRHMIAISLDMAAISVGMYSMGEVGAIMFSLYLWAIVGYGLRFGKSYMYIALACALCGFAIMVMYSPYWAQHKYFTIGMLVGIVILPMYYSKLLTRLTDVNASLEKRVSERTLELAEARDEALDASRAKSQFLSNMSHELRTPLNAIIGYSELLEESAKGENRVNDIEDIHKISAAGQHLLDMINDILDLNRIESGINLIEQNTVNVSEFLSKIKETMQPQLEKNHNTLEVEVQPKLKTIKVDKIRMRQVLLNIVSNANKFTQHGRITLKARLNQRENEQSVEFVVNDTGIGISERDQAVIFDPFTQLDSSFSRRYDGSGLGLTVSRNYCRMMGGDIRVSSHENVGSEFVVRLPIDNK